MTTVGYLQNSTTLFPQRIKNPHVTNKDLSCKIDAFKSEYELHATHSSKKQSSQFAKRIEPVKITLNTEKQTKAVVQVPDCESSSCNNKSISSPQKRIKEMKPKCVKCFLCDRLIKVEHLSEHILFGEVKCVKCEVVFKDCQDFQLWTVESKMGDITCDHVLEYSGDPLETIKGHLSRQLENVSIKSELKIESHLKTYINRMESLSNKLPWQQVILQFMKSKENSKCLKLQSKKEIKKKKKEEGRKVHSNHINNNNVIQTLDGKFSCSSSISSQEYKEQNALQNIKKMNVYDFLSEEYASGDSTTHNKASKHDLTSKMKERSIDKVSHMDSKVSPTKKRKSVTTSVVSKKKVNGYKQTKSKDYVETPSNGFYYVVRHSITECPNCYAVISPPDFTVNIVTFLMTAICTGCGLTIYIVHDPPDDSAARVCIVTDQKATTRKVKQLSPRKKFNHKALPKTVIA